MTQDKLAPELRFGLITEIIARAALTSPRTIQPDTDIFETLGVDSLGIVEIFVEIDLHFGVKVNPASIERDKIRTPQLILALIAPQSLP